MENSTTDPAVAARLREAFIYTFPVHDLAQVRWQITQNPQNRNRVPVMDCCITAGCSTIAPAP